MSNQAYNEIYGARADAGSSEPQAAMLDQMRDRLASLSDEARSIRSQVPHEFEPDVERIQQQMQRLGERLSDLGRGALVPYNSAMRATETRTKTVRFVTEEDMRVARVQPDEIIVLGGPGAAKRHDDASNPWDAAAANALVELYESGEAYASYRRQPVRTQAPRSGTQAASGQASQQALSVAAAAGAMTGAPQAEQRGCAIDTNYLDQRFAEIAVRIEQSLARMRPENALQSLGSRFDALETQLNSVLGHVATRADLDELRAAEAQIEEISNQLAQFRRQLARLDVIDAHLGTLTSQLCDERLSRLVSADNGRLDAIDAQLRMIAVQLSDERLSGLVSRSSGRDDYEDLANSAAQRAAATFADGSFTAAQSRDIGEVRGMLENLINERRHSDENNASMLETMQHAIIRVLDRIDAIEIAQQAPAAHYETYAPPAQAPVPAYAQAHAQAPAYAPAPAQAAAPAMPASLDDLVPPTARVYAEMPRVEADHTDFLPQPEGSDDDADVLAYHEDAQDDLTPPRVPYTTASFDIDAAFSRSRDAEAEAFGMSQPPKRSMEVLRHDFIADAHRAKLKAASKPDMAVESGDLRAGELSVNPKDMPAKPRARRSIFSFRSQKVAMSLLVLLAAIPAAIFFMPRTPAAKIEAVPAAAIVAPAPVAKQGGALPATMPAIEDPAMPGAPDAEAPAMSLPPKQTNQIVPPLEKGEYEDVNADGASIDTASLPGIQMQDSGATGQQLAQMNEQARMAYLSGQLGMAAAKVTPAALMEEHVLRNSGVAPAADELAPPNGESKLPPATVGPYSLRIAAAKGDASAQFEVASRLAEGKGTDQDLKEASQWYQRAAAGGFAMAQFRLGTLYERGLGVKPDSARAQIWYERAAAQGNVKAMHNLAVLAASRNPKGDYERAAHWFNSAADYGLADSQYNLAVLYENGMGVGKDMQQAYKWLLLAAKQGDKDAAARRDVLKPKMSATDLAAAETQAGAWRGKPIQGVANDARVAGQVWRESNRRG
jgi:localization factor PodJL